MPKAFAGVASTGTVQKCVFQTNPIAVKLSCTRTPLLKMAALAQCQTRRCQIPARPAAALEQKRLFCWGLLCCTTPPTVAHGGPVCRFKPTCNKFAYLVISVNMPRQSVPCFAMCSHKPGLSPAMPNDSACCTSRSAKQLESGPDLHRLVRDRVSIALYSGAACAHITWATGAF